MPASGSSLTSMVEDAAALWLWRACHVRAPNVRLIDFLRVDERVEAHVDALRVAGAHGLTLALEMLSSGTAGAFFASSILAIESSDTAAFDRIIDGADE